jgi:hypothetical protein
LIFFSTTNVPAASTSIVFIFKFSKFINILYINIFSDVYL